MKKVNKKYCWYTIYLCALIIGCISSMYRQKTVIPEKYKKYVFPYKAYTMALYGDTTLYEKVVKERQEKTPSHPDYFDLSIKIARSENYTPAYYNAYCALNDLYKYNHFTMGDKVKRLMYSYLQLAIDNKDHRVTKVDLKNYQQEFPKRITTREINSSRGAHGDGSSMLQTK